MIIVEGTVRIVPGTIEKMRPVMEQMIRASRAEPGCIDYAYAVDVLDDTLVRIHERWESRDALEAHFKTAHMDKWRSFLPTMGISERSLRLYEAEPEEF